MASSSARQEIESSNQQASSYEVRGRTMSLEEWELNVQVENPVDLLSLAHHGCDLRGIYQAQDLMDYFGMINGPTYLTLVRHFWVRAQIYDLKASQLEMDEKVLIDPSLEGKTREEMGLKPFRREEIRSSIMGIPVVISVDTIAGVIRRASEGRFVYGMRNKNSPWIPIVNRTMFNNSTKGKYKELDMRTKMLLKIQNENLLPKGSGEDKPSLDHKVFLHFFLTRERANVPKYIFRHLIKNLKDSQTIKKNFVPYGRLISEIFHQGGILDALKKVNYFTDAQLGTITGRIINEATLVTMKPIRKEDHKELSTDLKESSVISNLMDDFPLICKQDPLEVRVMFIKEYFEMTGQIIKISDIPDEMYGGALPIAKNRKSLKRKMTEAEYLDDTPEFAAKIEKFSAPQPNPSTSDMLLVQQEAPEADDYEVLTKKTKQVDPEYIIEINSGTSSSYVSSDSSEFDDSTLSLIDKINKFSEKATKSVPKKTDSVNQQSPQTSHETTSEQTSTPTSIYPIPLQMILPEPVAETMVHESVQVTASEPSAIVTVPKPSSTQIQTQTQSQTHTHTSPFQMIIPEPVVEIVVLESVQVTESDPSVTITVSEPIQKPTKEPKQTLPTTITNDQPSSSSSIQNLKQTPPNLLKFEFLEAEMLEISNDLQRLVQLRRSPTLSVAYEEKWATLKTRASELLNSVSQKCIKIQAAAYKHHFSTVHSIEEDQAPLLYLANTPYFPESDYVTREAKMFKLLKQKVLKQQEDAKAREDLLRQRQLELEAALKEQAALIAQLMNKQPNP